MHEHFCWSILSEKEGDPDDRDEDKEDGEKAYEDVDPLVESNGVKKEGALVGTSKRHVELVLNGFR